MGSLFEFISSVSARYQPMPPNFGILLNQESRIKQIDMGAIMIALWLTSPWDGLGPFLGIDWCKLEVCKPCLQEHFYRHWNLNVVLLTINENEIRLCWICFRTDRLFPCGLTASEI